MKDLTRRCIFDNSTNNLNTIMEISLDDEKYKVAVCEACEDDASPGAIKKVIPERLATLEKEKEEMRSKMDLYKELAEEMGFVLVKKEEWERLKNVKTPRATSRPPIDPNILNDLPTVQIGNGKFKMQKNTRKDKADAGLSREEAEAAVEVAAKRDAQNGQAESATLGEAASYANHEIPDQISAGRGKTVGRPTQGAKKMQTVRGAAGLPTAIPRSLHGSDGETTISIVNTGGDKTIQMRGKQLAQMRQRGDQSHYSQQCRPCQGTGFHAKRECKACGGAGIVI